MGNAHHSVVDGHGQLIGIQAVGTTYDEIAAGPRQIRFLPAIHAVAERHGGSGHVDAPRRVFLHRSPFRRRHAVAMPVVHASLAGVGRADSLQSGPAAVAGVQQAAALQRRQRAVVQSISFLLHIRPSRAAPVRSFVPGQPQPLQVPHQGLGKFCFRPLLVDVFHAQDQRAAGLPDLEPAQKRRPRVSQMHVSRRAGRKTTSHRTTT